MLGKFFALFSQSPLVFGAVAAGVLIGLFLLGFLAVGRGGASQSVQLFGTLLALAALLSGVLAVMA